MPIRFFNQEIDFKLKNPRKLKSWIDFSARLEKRNVVDINYIFCSDNYLLKLNQSFLGHNTFTDIITFDNSEGVESLSGEIYISIERVRENSLKYESPFEEEINRVMIHGILHLCGYKDKKPSEVSLMRKKESIYLSLWKKSFT